MNEVQLHDSFSPVQFNFRAFSFPLCSSFVCENKTFSTEPFELDIQNSVLFCKIKKPLANHIGHSCRYKAWASVIQTVEKASQVSSTEHTTGTLHNVTEKIK